MSASSKQRTRPIRKSPRSKRARKTSSQPPSSVTTDLDAVQKALASQGWNVASMRIGWRPKNPVTVDEAARAEVEQFLNEIDEDEDVQQVYAALA